MSANQILSVATEADFQAEVATRLSNAEALFRSYEKIAFVGFTPTRKQAPWDDPTWLKAGCNNLWKQVPEGKYQAWFDLHPIQEIRKNDPEHLAWLRNCPVPVFVTQAQPDWPTSITFPKELVLSRFPAYFTNTISWQIALALIWGMDTMKHLGIWGVDMAQNTEYSKQRPSVEFFLGAALGRGVGLHIPQTSDLLKCAAQYGFEDDSPMRMKMQAQLGDLRERLGAIDAEINRLNAGRHQVIGAVENLSYWLGTWTTPAANRDGSAKEEEVPTDILAGTDVAIDAAAELTADLKEEPNE